MLKRKNDVPIVYKALWYSEAVTATSFENVIRTRRRSYVCDPYEATSVRGSDIFSIRNYISFFLHDLVVYYHRKIVLDSKYTTAINSLSIRKLLNIAIECAFQPHTCTVSNLQERDY